MFHNYLWPMFEKDFKRQEKKIGDPTQASNHEDLLKTPLKLQ